MNLGADFCLMPSMFEPGGIVQQEFFVAGTPCIAFKTGGLKDTVFEFDKATKKGNGFTFEAHTKGDFMFAMQVRGVVVGDRGCLRRVPSRRRAAVRPSPTRLVPPPPQLLFFSAPLRCTTIPHCTQSFAATPTTP